MAVQAVAVSRNQHCGCVHSFRRSDCPVYGGDIWGVLSAILSTCAFNAFFTEPYFTLSVDDPNYFMKRFSRTSVITLILNFAL